MTDVFDDNNEIQPQSINWGKVEDYVAGTKISQRSGIKTKFGENTLYEIKVERGVFHAKDGEEIVLKAGDVWGMWGRNSIFNGQMDRMKIGQKFGIKFVESKPSSMGNDAKIIKVYTTGEMDTVWMEENGDKDFNL
jgi:hypothetical protein